MIARLPATALRPGDEPTPEPPQPVFIISPPSCQSQDQLSIPKSHSFYYEEVGAPSSSTSPPDSPTYPCHVGRDEIEIAAGFMSKDPFTTPLLLGLEKDKITTFVPEIPISLPALMAARDCEGMDGKEEDEEGMDVSHLPWIYAAMDLVSLLWPARWSSREYG